MGAGAARSHFDLFPFVMTGLYLSEFIKPLEGIITKNTIGGSFEDDFICRR